MSADSTFSTWPILSQLATRLGSYKTGSRTQTGALTRTRIEASEIKSNK